MIDATAINLVGIPEGLRPAVGQLLQELADTLKPGGAMAKAAMLLGATRVVGRLAPSLSGAALGPMLKGFARTHGAELSTQLVQTIVTKVQDAVKPGRHVG